MKLLELTTAGFRVPDRSYSLRAASGLAEGVSLITGPAGSGKTSLLACIAAAKEGLAPYGAPVDVQTLLRTGSSEGLLRALWRLSEEELARSGLSGHEHASELVVTGAGVERKADRGLREVLSLQEREPGIGRLELFPAHRRLNPGHWHRRQLPIVPAVEAGRRLAFDADKYEVLARVLHDVAIARAERAARPDGESDAAAANEGPDELAPYRDAVAAMVPGLELAGVTAREGGVAVSLLRSDGTRTSLPALPSSDEQAVLFALAYAWLGLDRSVWLIDTPEQCIASRAQAGFLERLAGLGTECQLIVATGSDALIAAARPTQIVDMTGADGRAVIEAARGGSSVSASAPAASSPKPAARRPEPDSPARGPEVAPESLAEPASVETPIAPTEATVPAMAPPASIPAGIPAPAAAFSPGPSAPTARRLESSPWARRDPLDAPAEPPPAPSSAKPEPAPPPPAGAVGQTREVDLATLLAPKPAVPFDGQRSVPAPSGPSDDDGPRPAPAQGPLPAAGETAKVSTAVLQAAAEAMPFSPKAPAKAKAPELTLEQYASYSAELVVTPSKRSRILETYGIASPAARVALATHWGKRFEEEPELKAKFETLQAEFVAWLRTKGAKPR